jgi:EAL domain-containing protein (putative c-di-GMP-specific phosphodiesterase class I)
MELLRSMKRKDVAKLFVVKICNYELLSILLSDIELERLMSEVDTMIISHVQNLGYKDAKSVREHNNVAFIIHPVKSFAVHEFAYSIYKKLQLHILTSHQSAALQCRISSAEITNDINPLPDLLCILATQEASNYYVEYDPGIRSKVNAKYIKLREFQRALQNKHLSFAYQPIIERATGFIPYYECLLRIANDSTDVVSVGTYMPIVESIGLNNIVDQTVLRMAVNELHAAHHVSLSVNISNAGITDPYLLQIAEELLSDQSIAKRLIIEITETSLNMDFDYTKRFTETLRSFGCKIALDDFGTGFTSFKQLQNLPIDVIKIDGSFIRDIAHNQRNQHLVLALIDIAEQLGAKTVAEFVETGEIAKFLLDAKIDYMQGNFFSPALNYRSWDKN